MMMRLSRFIATTCLIIPQLTFAQLWPRIIVQETPEVKYATRLGGKIVGGTEVLVEDFEGTSGLPAATNTRNGLIWYDSGTGGFPHGSYISGTKSLSHNAGSGAVTTNLIPGLLSVSFKIKSSSAEVSSITCRLQASGGSELAQKAITPSTSVQEVVVNVDNSSEALSKLQIIAAGSGYILVDDFKFTLQKREYLYADASSIGTYDNASNVTLHYEGLTNEEKSGTTYGDISQKPPYYATLPVGPVRDGYSFVGWQVGLTSGGKLYRKDGSEATLTDRLYPAGTAFLVSTNVTLTAVYTKCDHCFPVRF